MSGFPGVVVEVAFNAGYTTPAASRTWTDVSSYVEWDKSLQIDFGRRDERTVADANKLTLTLNNSDGRFTAGRSGSPYYPNVRIGRPIRVTVTPPSGSAQVRFFGFVDEWPTEWPGGSPGFALARITASSRMARLGFDAALRSIVEEEFLIDGPIAYYTLGEPAGSTSAADSSGNATTAVAMVATGSGGGTNVVFGSAIGPGTDGLTAAQFANNGKFLLGGVSSGGVHPSKAKTIEAFVTTAGSGTARGAVFELSNLDASVSGYIGVRVDGLAVCQSSPSAVVGTTAINDGNLHHLAMTDDGTTIRLYVDGVLDNSGASSGITSAGVYFSVGYHGPNVVPDSLFNVWNGVVAHAAFYPTALSAARIAAHAAAGSLGFAGELSGARITRYAGYADIPAAEVTADTGVATLLHFDCTGKTALECMRIVEASENGILFDAPSGALRFIDRDARYGVAATATLDASTQVIEPDYLPKLDRSTLVNDAVVNSVGALSSGYASDQTSRDDYGRVTSSVESATDSQDDLQQRAAYTVARYKDPASRAPSLTVNLAQSDTTSVNNVYLLDPSKRVDVTNLPSQAATSSAQYYVEGWTETIKNDDWRITLNVSPAAGANGLGFWALDSATNSQLGSTTVLAY